MTEKEIVSIIKTLKAYYPYVYKDLTPEDAKEIINVWKTHFKDLDYELVKKGVDEWGGTQTKPPSIAELKSSLYEFYREYDMQYSKLINEKADPKEIARIGRLRSQAWDCLNLKKK